MHVSGCVKLMYIERNSPQLFYYPFTTLLQSATFSFIIVTSLPVSSDSSVGIQLRARRPGDRIPVEQRFFAALQTGLGAHAAFCTRGNMSFPGVKRPRCGADHPPHLAPRLKKEYSYSSTPPLGLRGLYRVNFTFIFTFTFYFIACMSICQSMFTHLVLRPLTFCGPSITAH